jgi:glycosyltransferase involved in cell wall biosynthesis
LIAWPHEYPRIREYQLTYSILGEESNLGIDAYPDKDCSAKSGVAALPPDVHRTINALQRAADIVVQKSIEEGFGLTVTEALWKGEPVIVGDTGGHGPESAGIRPG